MPECFQVRVAIGHQGNGCAAVECCPPSVHVVEVRASFEEQHTVCRSLYRLVKHRRLSPRWNESNPVPVVAHLPQPLHRLAPERRVAPHPAVPRQRQPVIGNRVVLGRRFPRSHYRGARVEVKRSERPQDLGWRQPFIVPAVFLVRAQTHSVASRVAQPFGAGDASPEKPGSRP